VSTKLRVVLADHARSCITLMTKNVALRDDPRSYWRCYDAQSEEERPYSGLACPQTKKTRTMLSTTARWMGASSITYIQMCIPNSKIVSSTMLCYRDRTLQSEGLETLVRLILNTASPCTSNDQDDVRTRNIFPFLCAPPLWHSFYEKSDPSIPFQLSLNHVVCISERRDGYDSM